MSSAEAAAPLVRGARRSDPAGAARGGSPTGEPRPIVALAAGSALTRQAVSKHLAVLRGAGLVARRPAGRETLYALRPERLAEARAWLDEVAGAVGGRARPPQGACRRGLDVLAPRALREDEIMRPRLRCPRPARPCPAPPRPASNPCGSRGRRDGRRPIRAARPSARRRSPGDCRTGPSGRARRRARRWWGGRGRGTGHLSASPRGGIEAQACITIGIDEMRFPLAPSAAAKRASARRSPALVIGIGERGAAMAQGRSRGGGLDAVAAGQIQVDEPSLGARRAPGVGGRAAFRPSQYFCSMSSLRAASGSPSLPVTRCLRARSGDAARLAGRRRNSERAGPIGRAASRRSPSPSRPRSPAAAARRPYNPRAGRPCRRRHICARRSG